MQARERKRPRTWCGRGPGEAFWLRSGAGAAEKGLPRTGMGDIPFELRSGLPEIPYVFGHDPSKRHEIHTFAGKDANYYIQLPRWAMWQHLSP